MPLDEVVSILKILSTSHVFDLGKIASNTNENDVLVYLELSRKRCDSNRRNSGAAVEFLRLYDIICEIGIIGNKILGLL